MSYTFKRLKQFRIIQFFLTLIFTLIHLLNLRSLNILPNGFFLFEFQFLKDNEQIFHQSNISI